MIAIVCNNDCISEKKYVFEIIFSEFLGLDYSIKIDDELKEKCIIIPLQSTQLILPDIFFSKAEKNWMSKETLPILPLNTYTVTGSAMNFDLPYNDIPVLYGSASCTWKEDHIIDCGIDIFGSIFFMLSRYEEVVIKERDKRNRFSGLSSVCYSAGILLRPIVNEYLEMLWQLLLKLNPGLSRKNRQPQITLTCDVDWPFNPDNLSYSRMLKSMISNVIKRGQVRKAVGVLKEFIKVKRKGWEADSFNTFNYLMNLAEQHALTMVFYFICDQSAGAIDGNYKINDPLINGLMKEIHRRGHKIGLHSSYNTYLNGAQLSKEADILRNKLKELNIQQDELGVRQHYLRYQTPDTIIHLNNAGFDYDTTMSYAEHPGFRAGTCYEYSMYDLLNRSALKIKERPLIAMEHTVISKGNMELGYTTAALNIFKQLRQQCHLYNGNFILLWHNSFFVNKEDKIMLEAILS